MNNTELYEVCIEPYEPHTLYAESPSRAVEEYVKQVLLCDVDLIGEICVGRVTCPSGVVYNFDVIPRLMLNVYKFEVVE